MERPRAAFGGQAESCRGGEQLQESSRGAGVPSTAGAAIPCVTEEPLPAAEELAVLGGSIGKGFGRDQLKHGTR